MKKWIYLWGICILSVLLVVGCSDESESGLVAKKEDLENSLFKSDRYQFTLIDNKLEVIGHYNTMEKEYTFDEIYFPEGGSTNTKVWKEYDNVKVKTDAENYSITADGLSINFKKFMNHIITDEEGNEFIKIKLE